MELESQVVEYQESIGPEVMGIIKKYSYMSAI